MLSGERKKFGLRPTRKSLFIGGLSNTVVVEEQGALFYCHVAFDQPLVQEVGRQLPRGISADTPAHLHIVLNSHTGVWDVLGCYVGSTEQIVLWRSEQKPGWIKELKLIRQIDNERTNQSTPGRTASDTNSARSSALAVAYST